MSEGPHMYMFSSLLSEQDKPCYYGQFSQLKHCWCGERSNKHEYFVLSNKISLSQIICIYWYTSEVPQLDESSNTPN